MELQPVESGDVLLAKKKAILHLLAVAAMLVCMTTAVGEGRGEACRLQCRLEQTEMISLACCNNNFYQLRMRVWVWRRQGSLMR